MGEIATAVKYELPVKVIIIKNNSLGQIKWEIKRVALTSRLPPSRPFTSPPRWQRRPKTRGKSCGAFSGINEGTDLIRTIGHSTRPIEDFIAILQAHAIEQVVDIRTIPRSRTNPQFNRENLPLSLSAAGILYHHMAGLGGLRKARPDSLNTAWRNPSFRGYADYMQTPEFETNLDDLIATAATRPTVIMCAEAVHWRCHRSLVSDALMAKGVEVEHVQNTVAAKPHRITSFAHVEGTRITYKGDQ